MASLAHGRGCTIRWLASILCSILLLTLCHDRSLAQSAAPDEYQVRAAIILNITRFITWPDAERPGSRGPFVVGLLGYDPGSAALEAFLGGRSINGHPVIVRRIPSADHIDECSLVYVTSAERNHYQNSIAQGAARGVLTVSDDARFVYSGGIVGLPVTGDHIEIEINLLHAQRSGLVVSSRLLHLATVVRQEESK
jgi:YfiR/HmsC-like